MTPERVVKELFQSNEFFNFISRAKPWDLYLYLYLATCTYQLVSDKYKSVMSGCWRVVGADRAIGQFVAMTPSIASRPRVKCAIHPQSTHCRQRACKTWCLPSYPTHSLLSSDGELQYVCLTTELVAFSFEQRVCRDRCISCKRQEEGKVAAE